MKYFPVTGAIIRRRSEDLIATHGSQSFLNGEIRRLHFTIHSGRPPPRTEEKSPNLDRARFFPQLRCSWLSFVCGFSSHSAALASSSVMVESGGISCCFMLNFAARIVHQSHNRCKQAITLRTGLGVKWRHCANDCPLFDSACNTFDGPP